MKFIVLSRIVGRTKKGSIDNPGDIIDLDPKAKDTKDWLHYNVIRAAEVVASPPDPDQKKKK